MAMLSTRGMSRAGSARRAAFALVCAVSAAAPALAQQKTGPGITGEDALTWNGITLYGVIDVGVQYDAHSAPFSDYRPGSSAEIVQKFSRESVTGLTSSNMGQSRIGLNGTEPLGGDWSAVFQAETFFNPQSGELADSLKAVTLNNGLTPARQSTFTDGSSAGQVFQTAFAGLSSKTFGTLTYGRQLTLLSQGTIKYDPQQDAIAFGLLGASGTYSGGGSSEDRRMNSMLKYSSAAGEPVHVAALYTFHESDGGAGSAFQANVGGDIGGLSVDATYSKIRDAITSTALSATQVGDLSNLGLSASNSLSATISDNTAYALMALYKADPLKFYAGYEHIRYADPSSPLTAGYTDIGGYVLAFVTDNAYVNDRVLQVYWAGVRYSVTPHLDLAAAYYGYQQNAYGTGKSAGCSTSASSTCSGRFEAVSFTADYRFNQHFDVYAGAMYSGVSDGLAAGYTFYTSNVNPTIGVRYKF
jgi:predicted porin